MRRLLALFLLVFAAPAHGRDAVAALAKWDPALFDRAAREDKYILLHMAAVWCHWCHVMERTTYRDPAIQQRIAEKFIAVRVDQDSDPALSYRYENWGWPATIMLDKDGNEIFKRRGYIPPELFGKLLAAVIEDPSALPTVHGRRRRRSQRRRTVGRAPRAHRGAAAQELRQDERRLRRHPSLHPWRHARMGAGAQPPPAAQRRARGVARDVGPHARRRAPPDRPGVGRHVPVFRQARLVGPALREAFEHPARRACAPTCWPTRSAAIPPTSPRRATSPAG